MSEIDKMIIEIENLFLKNTSIEEDHNGHYIEHENFISEMRKFLYSKLSIDNDIPRYVIREIVKTEYHHFPDENLKQIMTGIEYKIDDNGNWVLYNDIRNLLEDRMMIKNKLKEIEIILNQEHRKQTGE